MNHGKTICFVVSLVILTSTPIGLTGHISPNILSKKVDLEDVDNFNKNLTSNFVTIEGDQFMLNGKVYRVRGLNYIPVNGKSLGQAEWSWEQVDSDLKLATEDLNVNTVRIFISYQYSVNNTKYAKPVNVPYEPTPEYLEEVNKFLTLARKHNLRVIITLFGNLYWELYSPNLYWISEKYLEALIPKFATNPTIVAWDIDNEPDLDFGHCGKDNVIGFLRTMAQKIRMLDENHPTTVGFLSPEYIEDVKDYVDFVCFHWYRPASQLGDVIDRIREVTDKPILVEEFGLHTWPLRPGDPHDEEDQERYYRSTLAIMREKNVAGWLFWTLFDFTIRDGQETHNNHMGIFRNDYSPKPVVNVVRQFY